MKTVLSAMTYKLFFGAVCAFVGMAALAQPRVTVDAVQPRWPWKGKLNVRYTVVDGSEAYRLRLKFVVANKEPYIVTLGGEDMTSGSHVYVFNADEVYGEIQADATVTALVSDILADATGTPLGVESAIGDVMIIDLSKGPEAESYPVARLRGIDMGRFNCNPYKTTKIVLRKIPKGSVYNIGYNERDTKTLNPARDVAVMRDYYIGLFEVTEAQYAQVMGGPSTISMKPKAQVRYSEDLRGTQKPGDSVSNDSFLHRLCQRAGAGFDLPTELQWEIAERAGEKAPDNDPMASLDCGYFLKDGNLTEGSSNEDGGNWAEFAWYRANSENSAHPVGFKCPNAWGIYDMIGNVSELCLDCFANKNESTTAEAFVDADTNTRVVKGCSCEDDSVIGLSIRGEHNCSSALEENIGFRLCFMP